MQTARLRSSHTRPPQAACHRPRAARPQPPRRLPVMCPANFRNFQGFGLDFRVVETPGLIFIPKPIAHPSPQLHARNAPLVICCQTQILCQQSEARAGHPFPFFCCNGSSMLSLYLYKDWKSFLVSNNPISSNACGTFGTPSKHGESRARLAMRLCSGGGVWPCAAKASRTTASLELVCGPAI